MKIFVWYDGSNHTANGEVEKLAMKGFKFHIQFLKQILPTNLSCQQSNSSNPLLHQTLQRASTEYHDVIFFSLSGAWGQ